MNDDTPQGSDTPDPEWPKPPPYRPHYDKIIFMEGGRYLDAPPTWRERLRGWLGAFRPHRRNPT